MSEETMFEIVERMKSRRLELGYSYQDLANKTGMSKSTLQRYEAGAIKNIPLDKIKDLARGLSVTPEWLMGWDTSKDVCMSDEIVLNQTEKKLVLMFRSMDALSQAKLLSYGEGIVSTIQSSEYLTAQKIAEEAMGERKICTPAKHTV